MADLELAQRTLENKIGQVVVNNDVLKLYRAISLVKGKNDTSLYLKNVCSLYVDKLKKILNDNNLYLTRFESEFEEIKNLDEVENVINNVFTLILLQESVHVGFNNNVDFREVLIDLKKLPSILSKEFKSEIETLITKINNLSPNQIVYNSRLKKYVFTLISTNCYECISELPYKNRDIIFDILCADINKYKYSSKKNDSCAKLTKEIMHVSKRNDNIYKDKNVIKYAIEFLNDYSNQNENTASSRNSAYSINEIIELFSKIIIDISKTIRNGNKKDLIIKLILLVVFGSLSIFTTFVVIKHSIKGTINLFLFSPNWYKAEYVNGIGNNVIMFFVFLIGCGLTFLLFILLFAASYSSMYSRKFRWFGLSKYGFVPKFLCTSILVYFTYFYKHSESYWSKCDIPMKILGTTLIIMCLFTELDIFMPKRYNKGIRFVEKAKERSAFLLFYSNPICLVLVAIYMLFSGLTLVLNPITMWIIFIVLGICSLIAYFILWSNEDF